jgi:hypothetical protein
LSVRSGPRLGPPFIPCPCSLQGVSCRKITGAKRHPRETGIRVSASFPAAVGHTHWDWSSSDPALPLRGLTRERLSALDAGPHVASSACYCPLNLFGRRSADRFTRLLPAGSGHSRQDQTNLGHGAPIRRSHRSAQVAVACSPENGSSGREYHGRWHLAGWNTRPIDCMAP